MAEVERSGDGRAAPREIIKEASRAVYGWTDECAYDGQTADAVLAALRAAAGGADQVVLCWDGDECTLRGLEQTNVGKEMVRYAFAEDGSANAEFGLPADPLFRLTDVAVSSPEEDR